MSPNPPQPVCARPGCHHPLVRTPSRRGRPPIYCSPACRAHIHRRPNPAGPILVEVDHGELAGPSRPAERIWQVQLRRDPNTAIVATGLGRTTADALAAQIATILHPPFPTQGAAIN